MSFQLEDSLALLERTPAVLDAWLRGLPAGWIHANEGPQTWSAFDIVGHLIFGEQTDWIPRTKQLLEAGPDVVFAPFDRSGHEEAIRGKSIEALLVEFADHRSSNLEELRRMQLGPREFAMRAEHPELGPVRLDEMLSAWTVHDLAHLAQIARVMAKLYGDAVGPWRQYITLVRPRP